MLRGIHSGRDQVKDDVVAGRELGLLEALPPQQMGKGVIREKDLAIEGAPIQEQHRAVGLLRHRGERQEGILVGELLPEDDGLEALGLLGGLGGHKVAAVVEEPRRRLGHGGDPVAHPPEQGLEGLDAGGLSAAGSPGDEDAEGHGGLCLSGRGSTASAGGGAGSPVFGEPGGGASPKSAGASFFSSTLGAHPPSSLRSRHHPPPGIWPLPGAAQT